MTLTYYPGNVFARQETVTSTTLTIVAAPPGFRVVVTGYSISATGAAGTVSIQSAAANTSILIFNIPATGTVEDDNTDMLLAIEQSQDLEVVSSAGVTAEVTVFGRFIPNNVPFLDRYTYPTPL